MASPEQKKLVESVLNPNITEDSTPRQLRGGEYVIFDDNVAFWREEHISEQTFRESHEDSDDHPTEYNLQIFRQGALFARNSPLYIDGDPDVYHTSEHEDF